MQINVHRKVNVVITEVAFHWAKKQQEHPIRRAVSGIRQRSDFTWQYVYYIRYYTLNIYYLYYTDTHISPRNHAHTIPGMQSQKTPALKAGTERAD